MSGCQHHDVFIKSLTGFVCVGYGVLTRLLYPEGFNVNNILFVCGWRNSEEGGIEKIEAKVVLMWVNQGSAGKHCDGTIC